jgi:hypothetical protein
MPFLSWFMDRIYRMENISKIWCDILFILSSCAASGHHNSSSLKLLGNNVHQAATVYRENETPAGGMKARRGCPTRKESEEKTPSGRHAAGGAKIEGERTYAEP